MKRIILLVIVGLFTQLISAQTATNFNCKDCSLNNHDLFTELNAGKVIVIVWVMPCSVCISGALAGYTTVRNYINTNPEQVKFYLADDDANTPCSTLISWANTNGISNYDAVFSNTAVNMSGYGETGMPKALVIGGKDHDVYYNANGSNITPSGIQNAINKAIEVISTGVKENGSYYLSTARIYPNPSKTSTTISLNLLKSAKINIEVINQVGQIVTKVFNGNLPQGESTLTINTSEYNNGSYFISFSDGESFKHLKLVIVQ